MLRRYTSTGIENHVFNAPTTLIGSSSQCDIVVKGVGVGENHALIEYHPVMRSYWLRDLGTLGGTYCNDQTLYGMIELKPADVIKFGKSSDFIFDFPVIQPSPEKVRRTLTRRGHSLCTENGLKDNDNNFILPVFGNKINLKPGNEKFSRSSITSTKKLCQQQNNESDSSVTSAATVPTISKNVRPISSKITQKRSFSVGKEITKNVLNKKLPTLQTSKLISNSSGYSSSDLTSFLPQINGTDKKNKNIGNQLLQRIIRLQQELHRKDEEIIKLKEAALLPSTSGDRVHRHLMDYRVALAEAEAENTKLRGIIAEETKKTPENLFQDLLKRLEKSESNQNLTELIYRTFFHVSVEEMENINKMCVKFNNIKQNKSHQ